MNKIEEALSKPFAKNRIVFWYDEKQELLNQFNVSESKKRWTTYRLNYPNYVDSSKNNLDSSPNYVDSSQKSWSRYNALSIAIIGFCNWQRIFICQS